MIREARHPDDLEAAAKLWSIHHREAITAGDMLDRIVNWPPQNPVLRLVAEVDGEVVGFCRTGKMGATNGYMTDVVVLPEHRGKGFGRTLFEPMLSFARETGADALSTTVAEDAPEGLAFAEKMGFTPRSTLVRSQADLVMMNTGDWKPLMDGLHERGYIITSLAQAGGEAKERDFCDVYMESDQDTPDIEDFGLMDWETFKSSILGANWFDPHLAVYAEWEGQIVGISIAIPPSADTPTLFHTEFTGVRRSHRGLGLAKALKAEVLCRCRELGGTAIVTHNDQANAGMLEVNRQLGFVKTSVRTTLNKVLRVAE